ncbi:MAG: hypothetical protein VB102_00865 [Paludibacter sp.]|nr:hypothetical protein [Paludibacter sp.]
MKKILLTLAIACSVSFVWAETIVKDTIMATNNGYINEGAKTTKLIQSVWNMEVRTYNGFTRWGFVEIPLAKADLNAVKTEFRIYLTGEKLATKNADQTLNVNSYTSDDLTDKGMKLSLYALNYTFDKELTWETRTTPDGTNETWVGDLAVDNTSKDTYLVWDVTELVKTRKNAGDTHLRFRLTTKDATQILRLRQVKITTGETGQYFPRLVQERISTGIFDVEAPGALAVTPTVTSDYIRISEGKSAQIMNMHGQMIRSVLIEDGMVHVADLNCGMYFVKTEAGVGRFIKK